MSVAMAHWVDLPHSEDENGGMLTAVEALRNIPFPIRRAFYMHGTPPGVERGGHAHRDTHQILIAVSGTFSVELADDTVRRSFDLNDPNRALYMSPMTWVRLYDFSPGAVCLVLADTHYDSRKSLRSWDEFLRALSEPSGSAR